MLNILAIDGDSVGAGIDSTVPIIEVPSLHNLQRGIEQWKARALYLEQRNKEQQESAVQKISQMKRKYETIIDKKSAENEEQKKEIDRLRKKNRGARKGAGGNTCSARDPEAAER